MAEDKITLVCTSLNPNERLLYRMLQSAKGFDEIVLHFDLNSHNAPWEYSFNPILSGSPIRQYYSATHLKIEEAYNDLIGQSDDGWICCFCDDDYFYQQGLSNMIQEIKRGNARDCEIAHFKFRVSGHMPKEDTRGRINKFITGRSEYDLYENRPITPQLLNQHGRLPAGSFFRKSAWEKVGGFQGDKCHDWDLWKRMAEAGCVFKYFDHLVYNFVRRPGSAWERQNS